MWIRESKVALEGARGSKTFFGFLVGPRKLSGTLGSDRRFKLYEGYQEKFWRSWIAIRGLCSPNEIQRGSRELLITKLSGYQMVLLKVFSSENAEKYPKSHEN